MHVIVFVRKDKCDNCKGGIILQELRNKKPTVCTYCTILICLKCFWDTIITCAECGMYRCNEHYVCSKDAEYVCNICLE